MLTVNLESTMNLPCILDKESTMHEWMSDLRGNVVLGPEYAQIEARGRRMFHSEAELCGNDGTLGMDVMDKLSDMPLVRVLMFQQKELTTLPDEMVDEFFEAGPQLE